MKVTTKEKAWNEANKLMLYDYDYDAYKSRMAGYPIYSNDNGEWISDLGGRLEVNYYPNSNHRGIKTINIWIVSDLETSGFHKNALGIWVM